MNDSLSAASALLAQQSSYHNHKEQMAHLSAAAYIAAAATFAFSHPTSLHWSVVALLTVTGLAGLFYVARQLDRRDEAARAVKVCHDIITAALSKDDRVKLTAPEPDTRLSKWAIIVTMLLWATLAFYEALRGAGFV